MAGHCGFGFRRRGVLNKAMARQGTQAGGGFVFQTSWFEGEIYVNNLSFGKRVAVRHTAHHWGNGTDTDAGSAGPVGEGTYATSAGSNSGNTKLRNFPHHAWNEASVPARL